MSDKKPLKYSHSRAAPSKRRAFQIMDGVWSVKLWPRNTVVTGNTAIGTEAWLRIPKKSAIRQLASMRVSKYDSLTAELRKQAALIQRVGDKVGLDESDRQLVANG